MLNIRPQNVSHVPLLFSGYTNKATNLEIRKLPDNVNYLNFPFVKFLNMSRADGFDINYIFLHVKK